MVNSPVDHGWLTASSHLSHAYLTVSSRLAHGRLSTFVTYSGCCSWTGDGSRGVYQNHTAGRSCSAPCTAGCSTNTCTYGLETKTNTVFSGMERQFGLRCEATRCILPYLKLSAVRISYSFYRVPMYFFLLIKMAQYQAENGKVSKMFGIESLNEMSYVSTYYILHSIHLWFSGKSLLPYEVIN